ncbi:hypothetical protein [Frigoriglobus tundricola]|uniref:HEAT repeat domain-containing protein n=1 Tax=Frigoriglobus tundricola TaxID=2774151 RepID=A0A6M5YS53_9BACT|nr:hypothetical protein [Frigoriglobus tundricola]QJW96216.1 hypothetical protein FTUN_3773 [Frigoriglobus tundricola]
MSRIRAVLLVCGAVAAVPAFGASPNPKDLEIPAAELSKARELVRRLGSEAYREREEAQAELAKMGRIARLALVEGAMGDADPEIRSRCSRLAPKATADDLKARLETFLADTEGKYDHDLPGFKAFRKALGPTHKIREMYAEILKSPYNLELFSAIDKGATEGGRAIADRRSEMWNDMQHRPFLPGGKPFVPKQPSLTDIAALLFAETLVPADHIPKNAQWLWVNGAQFVQQQASVNALSNSTVTHADAYKLIVGQWLSACSDPNELSNLAHLFSNGGILSKFKEATPLLHRIIRTEGVQGYARGQAVHSLIQNRGKEEAAFLRALLKDDSMLQQVWLGGGLNGQQGPHNCLMKDVALAHLILQSGGNIKDYGYETQQGAVINANQFAFGQYAFPSDEKRAAAFMKFGWKQLKDSIDGPKESPKETSKETPKAAPVPTAPSPSIK